MLRFALCALAVSAAAVTSPASAQSANVLPDLTTTATSFDLANAASLPAEAKTAFSSALAKMKTGEIAGLILVASTDGASWALNVAPKSLTEYDPSDSARQALEICEFRAGRPCAVLSVDGYEAGKRSGSGPEPQAMLSDRPSDFDATRLPFVPASKRAAAATYLAAEGPRAFAVTTSGLWLWRGGATVREAVDKTMSDCGEEFKPADCILYAVGARVVFGAQ
jgi:hypothetical protein